MPDHVICWIMKLGKQSKQKHTAEWLAFLSRHQENSAWDVDTNNANKLLFKPSLPVDSILTEISSLLLKSDFVYTSTVIGQLVVCEINIVATGAWNAYLDDDVHPLKITGVNEPMNEPPLISNDKGEGINNNHNDEVEFFGTNLDTETLDFIGVDNNLNYEDAKNKIAMTAHALSNNDGQSKEDSKDERSMQEIQWKSIHIRKKHGPLEIDFNDKAYCIKDSVMHLKPSFKLESRVQLRILGDNKWYDIWPKWQKDRIGWRSCGDTCAGHDPDIDIQCAAGH